MKRQRPSKHLAIELRSVIWYYSHRVSLNFIALFKGDSNQ